MGLFDQFPYTNFHELNLMWILEALKEIQATTEQFVAINSLKYADPIQWNIVKQYEKNTIVIDPLTGTAYISVQPVPTGVAITNTDYWTVVFDLGSFVTRAAQNFTDRWEEATTLTATFASGVNDWLIWGDRLYRVISPITAGDQYVVGSNIEHFTLESIIGHLEDLNTEDKSNLVAAINNVLQTLADTAGALDGLNTTNKSNLVAAINEVLQTLADTAGALDGLNTTNKSNLVAAINEVLQTLADTAGDLDSLSTTDKSNLVSAINEVITDIDEKYVLAKAVFMPVSNLTPNTASAGDCTVFITDKKKVVMIDTGHTYSYTLIKNKLIELGVSHIDYFILTHYHVDHYGNINSLIADGYIDADTVSYLPRSAGVIVPDWGDEAGVRSALSITTIITLDSSNPLVVDDMTFSFFNCDAADVAYYDSQGATCNAYSVLCYVTYRGTSILMCADSGKISDDYVVDHGYVHKCDIMKIGHHGIGDAGQNIYMVARPTYAVFNQVAYRMADVVTTYEKIAMCDLFNIKTVCTAFGSVDVGLSDSMYGFTSASNIIHSNNSYVAKVYVGANNNAKYGTQNNPFTDINEALAFISSFGTCRRVDLFLINNYTYDARLSIKNCRNKLRIVGERTGSTNYTNIKQIYAAYCDNIEFVNLNVTFDESGIALEVHNCPMAVLNYVNIEGNQTGQSDGRAISINGSVLSMNNCTISNKKTVLYFGLGINAIVNNLSGSSNTKLVDGNTGRAKFTGCDISYTVLADMDDYIDVDFNMEAQHHYTGMFVPYSRYVTAGSPESVTLNLSGSILNHSIVEILTSNGDVYRATRFSSSFSTISHEVTGNFDASQTCNITTSGLNLTIEHDRGVIVKVYAMKN